uniref:Uncharacterized protein n=1 Tax=Moniliophthora roreri TaxID=221103 RepID=A0A0W0FCV3_MONRR
MAFRYAGDLEAREVEFPLPPNAPSAYLSPHRAESGLGKLGSTPRIRIANILELWTPCIILSKSAEYIYGKG